VIDIGQNLQYRPLIDFWLRWWRWFIFYRWAVPGGDVVYLWHTKNV